MGLIQTIQVPLLAVNDTFLTVVEVKYATGDYVKKGDCLMVFETSKTTYDVEAEEEGYIEILCEAGSDYEVNAIVAHIHDSPVSPTATPERKAASQPAVLPAEGHSDNGFSWEGETLFSHAALQLLESNRLDRSIFTGRSFVNSEDVLMFTGKQPARTVTTSPALPKQPSAEVLPVDTDKVEIRPFTKSKKTEIQFLGSVQLAGMISTLHVTIETDGLFVHLNRSLKYFRDSLLPVMVYEVARLLKEYKELNAYYTPDGIAFYKEVIIGFAVDMEKGLKVLKIPNAATSPLAAIESDIFKLSEKYLDDKINLEDLTDISFTITDLSAEGVSSFIPLVNYLNAAILGIGAIDAKLQRVCLSLTFDHRVTEGKRVAQFLAALKERIESYAAAGSTDFADTIHCSNCGKSLREDLGGLGFVKSLNKKGQENYVCQTCYKGF